RVDPLELQAPPVGKPERLLDLSPLEQLGEDAQRGGPAAQADARPGLGERLGDGESETRVVGDSGDEGALARQIDRQHVQIPDESAGKGSPLTPAAESSVASAGSPPGCWPAPPRRSAPLRRR